MKKRCLALGMISSLLTLSACKQGEVTTSLSDRILDALLSTIMGMSIVFLVLILISLIIWLLKYVPVIIERRDRKRESVMEVATQVGEIREEELIEDTQLVAVITAAILASMGEEAPSNGLVVRSIRRVNKNWKTHN